MISHASLSSFTPEPATFHILFPFHVVINESLRVVQVDCSG